MHSKAVHAIGNSLIRLTSNTIEVYSQSVMLCLIASPSLVISFSSISSPLTKNDLILSINDIFVNSLNSWRCQASCVYNIRMPSAVLPSSLSSWVD